MQKNLQKFTLHISLLLCATTLVAIDDQPEIDGFVAVDAEKDITMADLLASIQATNAAADARMNALTARLQALEGTTAQNAKTATQKTAELSTKHSGLYDAFNIYSKDINTALATLTKRITAIDSLNAGHAGSLSAQQAILSEHSTLLKNYRSALEKIEAKGVTKQQLDAAVKALKDELPTIINTHLATTLQEVMAISAGLRHVTEQLADTQRQLADVRNEQAKIARRK